MGHIGEGLIGCSLERFKWTHEAHLASCLWILVERPDGRRLDIVHRDVSPGNIMATWDGHIKLADFGIAKASTSIDPAAKRPMLMGKKHYMSPEQILGLSVDAKSDVFAMGVVLYELLALEPLFTEDLTMLAIDEVAIHPMPSIRSRVPQIEGARALSPTMRSRL